MATCYEGDR